MVDECSDHAVRLKIAGTPCKLFLAIHDLKLKQVEVSAEYSTNLLTVDQTGRVDLNEALVPEDSYGDLKENECEGKRSWMDDRVERHVTLVH